MIVLANLLWPWDSEARGNAETTPASAPAAVPEGEMSLFRQWSFDGFTPHEPPPGFSSASFGMERSGEWNVRPEQLALSPPNVMVGAASCEGACIRMLVADALQYEYPDVSVRLRPPREGGRAVGGMVFAWKDPKNFYLALVDLEAHEVELSKVVDGQETKLGRATVKPKSSPWHVFRVQRSTILSKDFIEVSFDAQLAVSVQDQSLGIGQVGLATRGETEVAFDNFHAFPLFSQRPLSGPAAY